MPGRIDGAETAIVARVKGLVWSSATTGMLPPGVRPKNRPSQEIDNVVTVSTPLPRKLRGQCLGASLYCSCSAGVIHCRKKQGSSSLMTSKASEKVRPLEGNLKREFENAVRDVYQAGLKGKTSNYRKPIFHRSGATAPESGANAEKRALADAAKALAQLWKVSPSR
jgi:hypothetical protein